MLATGKDHVPSVLATGEGDRLSVLAVSGDHVRNCPGTSKLMFIYFVMLSVYE